MPRWRRRSTSAAPSAWGARRCSRAAAGATALLGDAMEAVIAAVYLDGGLEAARALVLRRVGRADRGGARGRARCEDRAAGVGAGARPAAPRLRGPEPRGPGPCAGLLGRGAARRTEAARRPGRRRSGRRSRRRPRRCWRGWRVRRDPLRHRCAHRRAERRQVDAPQPHGRRQGLDRHPQGADDPRPHPRHRDRGRGAARLRRHAGPLPAAAAARPRHGQGGLGRGGGRGRGGAADRGAPRADRGRARDPRAAGRGAAGGADGGARHQQDRPGAGGEASRARAPR